MKLKFSAIIVLFLMLLSPQLVACAERKYVLKDSNYVASPQQQLLFWLDNDRVIFTGYQIPTEPKTKELEVEEERNIYIWDTRNDRSELFATNASLGCYFHGYIRYSIGREGKKGMLGRERTYVIWTEDKKYTYSKESWEGEQPDVHDYREVRPHPITCRSYNPKGLPADYVELLPKDGYLSFKISPLNPPPGPSLPITLYRPQNSEGIKLPLSVGQVNTAQIYYIEFLDAYLLYSHNYFDPVSGKSSASWPKELPKLYWLMKSDGTVTEQQIQNIPGSWHHVRPLRRGVFGFGGEVSIRGHRGPGTAGAYWIENDRLHRLSKGLVNVMAVSPDGCKVAFVNEPYDDDKLPITERLRLHALDVCSGG